MEEHTCKKRPTSTQNTSRGERLKKAKTNHLVMEVNGGAADSNIGQHMEDRNESMDLSVGTLLHQPLHQNTHFQYFVPGSANDSISPRLYISHDLGSQYISPYPRTTGAVGIVDDQQMESQLNPSTADQIIRVPEKTAKQKLLGDTPSRNIDLHKDRIAAWRREGKSQKRIKMLLEEIGVFVGTSTIVRRLLAWDIDQTPRSLESKRPYIALAPLEPFKEELLTWHLDGLTDEDIAARLQENRGISTNRVSVERALDILSFPENYIWRSAHSRAAFSSSRPSDLLSDTEWTNLVATIRSAYMADNSLHAISVAGWSERLTDAACCDKTLQALMVREYLQPGCHWSSSRSFDIRWILGIQLPGCFTLPSVDSVGKIIEVIASITPQVLTSTKERLQGYLDESVRAFQEEHREEDLEVALRMTPLTTPAKCITDLMDMCKIEMIQAEKDREIIRSLNLPGVQGLPLGTELLACLNRKQAGSSLRQTFACRVSEGLHTWYQPDVAELPNLTSEEIAMVELQTGAEKDGLDDEEDYNDFVMNGESKGEGGVVDERNDFDSQHRDEISSTNDLILPACLPRKYRQQQRYGRLYVLLSDQVRFRIPKLQVFRDWRSPTSGALQGYPPSRFETSNWEPRHAKNASAIISRGHSCDTTTQKSLLKVTASFLDARRFSQDETAVLGDPESAYQSSISFLRQIICNQNSHEKANYEAICRRMAACCRRPTNAELIPGAPFWTPNVRDDNWWHCRRLLQMLAQKCSMSKEVHRSIELRLISLLAAVEGGSSEALMWIIAIDGLLVETSSHVKDLPPNTAGNAGVRKELLQELATFVHATVLTNLALRFHYSKASRCIQKWYLRIYQVEPRCAYQGCLGLLRDPRDIPEAAVESTFSVGMRWRGRGTRTARSFISSNRVRIYNCLVTWLRGLDPNPVLINAFCWYAGIFHDSKCKAGRGKWPDSF